MQSLQPDCLLNYQTADWAALIAAAANEFGGGLDLVYDCAGGDVVSRAMALLKPSIDGQEGGRIVTIVNPSGQLAEAYRRNVAIHYEFWVRRRRTLERLRTLVERGQLRPLIDCVLPLEAVAEAHQRLEAGGVRGKIVLRVAS